MHPTANTKPSPAAAADNSLHQQRPPEPYNHSSPNLLVLGLGNDILSDDAIGLIIVNKLSAEFADSDQIDFLESCEMGLALLDHIVGYDEVIIVDSIITGKAAPGFIHEFDASELKSLPSKSPHFLGVGETAKLGRILGLQIPRRISIFAIETADPFTISEKLSPQIQASLQDIISNLRGRLDLWRRRNSRRACS